MDKIEMPMKIVDKIRQRLSDGDFALCTWSATELVESRDALLRADERQKAAEWISVKELLPEENHAVLIYYDKHMIEAMFFDGDWGLPNGDWIMGHTVSFWMPLPFPPEIMAEPEEAHS